MKQITIISEENVPFEDFFKGEYEAHKVADKTDTYVVVKTEKEHSK
jgi:hypothetical protein